MELIKTETFERWLTALRDVQARSRILLRLRRIEEKGLMGDAKLLGGGLLELRIDYGPGYRVYCAQVGAVLVLLLVGGDKSTQSRDIAKARELLEEWRERER